MQKRRISEKRRTNQDLASLPLCLTVSFSRMYTQFAFAIAPLECYLQCTHTLVCMCLCARVKLLKLRSSNFTAFESSASVCVYLDSLSPYLRSSS